MPVLKCKYVSNYKDEVRFGLGRVHPLLILILMTLTAGCKASLKDTYGAESPVVTHSESPQDEVPPSVVSPPDEVLPSLALTLNAAVSSGDPRRVTVSGEGILEGVTVTVDASLNANCTDPVVTVSSTLPLVLQVPVDGHFFICGYLNGTIRNFAPDSQVQLKVDTSPPEAPMVSESTYGGPFMLDLAVTDLSGYSLSWSVVSGGADVIIADPSSPRTTVSATKEGDYVINAHIIDDGGRTTDREVKFKWRYCAGARLFNAPFANSGEINAGTSLNPYRICTFSQLDQARTALAASFELWSDIDASSTSVGSGTSGFRPIGDNSTGTVASWFTGVFDGRNYKITNLFINRPSESTVGLFGRSGGQIKNLTLVGVNIVAKENVGGLVGHNTALISHCRTEGQVIATAAVVGGLAGYNWGGVIELSSSSVLTSGTDWVGGLVGANLGWDNPVTILRDSFATGNVSGINFVGGLVGGTWGSNSLTATSFATGNVSGNTQVGGLVGVTSTGPTVTNCHASGNSIAVNQVGGFVGLNYRSRTTYSYSTGTATATGGINVGGFAGQVNTAGLYSIIGTYWDKDTSGKTTTAGASTGRTTAEMKQKANFVGWDFVTIWINSEGVSLPELRWVSPVIP